MIIEGIMLSLLSMFIAADFYIKSEKIEQENKKRLEQAQEKSPCQKKESKEPSKILLTIHEQKKEPNSPTKEELERMLQNIKSKL
jgi:biopolymer transport protein ExbD